MFVTHGNVLKAITRVDYRLPRVPLPENTVYIDTTYNKIYIKNIIVYINRNNIVLKIVLCLLSWGPIGV